jgi:imidazolonepropionase-like amidohydrolase
VRRLAVYAVVALLTAACGTASVPSPDRAAPPATVALVGGRVHASPETEAFADGVVLIEAGVITAVGTRAAISVPPRATVIDCTGGTVLAGFWNSHVHFMQPV